MQKVTHSEYIAQKKPLAKQLLAKLNEKYQYASVLITDNYEKGYRASRSGVAISATNAFGGKGMIDLSSAIVDALLMMFGLLLLRLVYDLFRLRKRKGAGMER